MPDENTGTDWSDVLIAAASNKYAWFAVILAIIVWSGWASPENVTEFSSTTLRAWRCQP